MSGKKISMQLSQLALIATLFFIGACASKNDVQENPLQPPTSDAAMLDDSEKSQAPDSQVFADLKPVESDSNAVLATGEPGVAPAVKEEASGDSPFYDPVGGESLGRVAYTLYGKKSYSKRLLDLNPNLSGAKSLTPAEKVFFNFDGVAPQPTFLTKGLLDRYAGQLAEGIEQKSNREGLAKSSAKLERGETLQKLSQRLYGTTRYWTEIYLLNRDKLGGYDKVRAGSDLVVYQRAAAPVVARVEEKSPPPSIQKSEPVTEIAPQQPMEPVMPSAAAVVPPQEPAPVEKPPVQDPIPDTSVAANSEPVSPPITQPTPSASDMPKATFQPQEAVTAGGNTNLRRIIYVVLILTIAGVAFYMTRPSKKQKFDMLDVTTGDTSGRSKLSKDSQNKSVS